MGCNSSHQTQLRLRDTHRQQQQLLFNQLFNKKIKQGELTMFQSNSTLKINLDKQELISYINHTKKEIMSEISTFQESKNFKGDSYKVFMNKIKQGIIQIFQQSTNPQKIKKQGLDLSNEVQDFIKNHYQKLIKQNLQALNEEKIISKEFKNVLSYSIVQLNLFLMQNIISKSDFQYNENIFKSLEEFQIQFIKYLKKKYPRGDNVDAGELSKQFKEVVDLTQKHENDILVNAGFCFDSEDEFQIMKTIKLLINKLIDETDQNFPIFKKLMLKHIFNQPAEKGYFQIGRKIPQNIKKYNRIDKTSLQIHSNQIFRILVKWIQDLRETVKKPQEKISSNSEWSLIRKNQNGDSQLISCPKYYKQLLIQNQLFPQIKKIQQKFKNERKKTQQFQISIIKGFAQINKYTPKHLSRQQAQIIKFSEYNMNFYKQIVQQKLITLIKEFIKISKQKSKNIEYSSNWTKGQNTQTNLNLIKFKISDLLRCKFQGNKEQIIEIYQKFKKLQKENKIKIIKIKNRFDTDLSDAMIIFKILRQNIKKQDLENIKKLKKNKKEQKNKKKMQNTEKTQQTIQQNKSKQQNNQNNKIKQNITKNSESKNTLMQNKLQQQCYLICQCQLILTQKSKSSNKKLKNIETLNHYLYELERSPFKILGQCILQLNYKYDIIKYASEIKNIKLQNNQHQFCQHQDKNQKLNIKQIQVKDQNFSMVCRGCWKFYQPFENISKIKTCQKCYKYLCYSCSSTKVINNIGRKENENKQTDYIEIAKKEDQIDPFLDQTNKKVFQKYLEYLCLIFNQKQYLLKNQNKQQDIKEYLNSQQKKRIYNQGVITLTLQRWTQKCLKQQFHQPTYNLTKHFKDKKVIKVKQLIQFIYKQYHQKDYKGSMQRIVFFILSYSKNRVIFRIYKFLTNDLKLVNVQNQQQSYEAHQLFQLNYHDAIYYPKDQNRQKYQQQRKQTSQRGYYKFCTIELLKKFKSAEINKKPYVKKFFYFGGYKRGNKIIYDKFDMQNNQKPKVQEFLQSLKRKKLVFINKNLGDKDIGQLINNIKANKDIKYQKMFKQLNLINLQNNKIQKIEEILQNCEKLEALYLNNNQINQIKFSLSLETLQVLELVGNQINKIEGLQNLKCLKRLDLSNNRLEVMINNDFEGSQSNKFEKNCLKFPFLTYLCARNNKIKFFPKLFMDKIQTIYFTNNQLQDLSNFFSSSFKKLKQLDLGNNRIKKIKLPDFTLDNLQIFHIYTNQITQFPDLNAPNLQILGLQQNDIKKISRQQLQRFKKLKQLGLSLNKNINHIPIFNHSTLKQFSFYQNNIQNILEFFKCALPQIKRILLNKSKHLTQLPNIDDFNKLQQLKMFQCPIFLNDYTIEYMIKQNSRYSKLKILYFSAKFQSQEQWNNKQKIIMILHKKVNDLWIQNYQTIISKQIQPTQQIPIQPTVTNQQQPNNNPSQQSQQQKLQQQKYCTLPKGNKQLKFIQ